MSTTLIVFSLASLVGLVWLLFLPFVARSQSSKPRRSAHNLDIQALDEHLSQVVKSVNDLDMDYDMGKVEPDDYKNHRKYLVGRGVSLLIKLDQATQANDDLEKLIHDYRQGSRA